MKSIHKTFDVLEYVVLQNGIPVTPTQAAQALAINVATCTRIMGVLVDRGYLVQISRKDGYAPGPMVQSLTTRDNAFARLTNVARAPIAQLSQTLGVQVNLAVLNQNRRIMLTFHLSEAMQTPWQHFFFTDQWNTATGRLLIAALPDKQAEPITRELNITPYPQKLLDDIRRTGAVKFMDQGLVIIGNWINVRNYPVAAFGFGVPPHLEDQATTLANQTAEHIRNDLLRPVRAY